MFVISVNSTFLVESGMLAVRHSECFVGLTFRACGLVFVKLFLAKLSKPYSLLDGPESSSLCLVGQTRVKVFVPC